MNIYIVAPYSAMESSLKTIISNYKNINISYGIGCLYDGLDLARCAQSNGFDVIISRGGTASLIKKNLNIPVVDMKLSGNDILKAILLANNGYRTSIVGYSNITTGAKEIIDLLGLNMQIYTISDYSDLTGLLIKLKKDNVEQILGDIVAVNKAKELMFETILFQSSLETIKIATDYAIGLVNQINKSNDMSIVTHKFFENTNKNYCILKDNRIIQSKFTDFDEMPISYEKLIGLKYEYKNKLKNNELLIDYSDELQVKLSQTMYENKNYYLYRFIKVSNKLAYANGISTYKPNSLYKLVYNSNSMKSSIRKFSEIINREKLAIIVSDDLFAIENILQYFYYAGNKDSSILAIDLKYFDLTEIDSLNLKNINSLIFKNICNTEQVIEIKKMCKSINKNVILILKSSYWLHDGEIISKVIELPKTKDRKSDIEDIFNHYIKYYNNEIGTKPLKIDKDFLQGFNYIKHESIYDLLNILSISIKNSKELILSFDEYYDYYKGREKEKESFFNQNLTLEEIELEAIKLYLSEEEYNQTKAADRLGISRATLWRKMKKYEL